MTGIVEISQAEFEAMPATFEGAWLREHFPSVATSMDRFIDKVKDETHGELVGDLEITRIPLDVYRARNATSRRWREPGIDHPLAMSPVFLLGDRRSDRPTSSRSRLASSARSSSPATSAIGPIDRDGHRTLRSVHVPAVAARLHADADDQAQQGRAGVGRRHMGLLAKLHVF